LTSVAVDTKKTTKWVIRVGRTILLRIVYNYINLNFCQQSKVFTHSLDRGYCEKRVSIITVVVKSHIYFTPFKHPTTGLATIVPSLAC